MNPLRRLSLATRWSGAIVSLLGLGAAGCFGDARDFHPHDHEGTGGQYAGTGGAGAGTGGASGVSGTGGVIAGTGGAGGALTGLGGAGGVNGGGGVSGLGGVSGGGGVSGLGGAGGGSANCSPTTAPVFTVKWTIEAVGGRPSSCAAVGGASMDLDVLNLATNVAYHDTFTCDAMSGVSSPLPAGQYSIAMRLRDAADNVISQADAPTAYTISANCFTDLGVVPFEAVVTAPDQYLSLSWSVDKQATFAPLSCAQANAATVELDAGSLTFDWPCVSGRASTATIAPGSYAVTVKLLDPSGTVLSLTQSMTVNLRAGVPEDLGPVLFDVR
jgi:hypothetical protein